MNTVWVLTGKTESGDDIGPEVWGYEPSQIEIENILSQYDEVEFCSYHMVIPCVVMMKE